MSVSAYDEIAEWYDQIMEAGSLLEDPIFVAVERLVGEVAGQAICDLACGQGRVARYLASRGAQVTGIDISGKLLALARGYEEAEPKGIVYLQDDAQRLHTVQDAVFDGVVCHMALMDIPDLAPTVQAIWRILRPSGWFVFSILHPCYQTASAGEIQSPDGTAMRTVSGYFEEGFWRSSDRPGPPGKVGSYHRTLTSYLNTLTAAGLVVEVTSEPRASESLAERRPVWREVPYAFSMRLSKRA